MPTVKAGDINIYYEWRGQGEPLLLIQGYGHYALHWWPLIPQLSKKYRVIFFDNRGTGRSDKPEPPYTTKMMATDAKELLDAIGIDKAHIFGVCVGGMTAQELALNYPDKVMSLILGYTSCGGKQAVTPTEEAMQLLFGPKMNQLPAEDRAREMTNWLWTQGFIDAHPKAVATYVDICTKFPTPTQGYAGQARAIMDHDAYDRLPLVKVPTLVMAGDSDLVNPNANSKIIASRIPGAKLVIVKNAGHDFTESPEAITVILDFLRRHPGGKK